MTAGGHGGHRRVAARAVRDGRRGDRLRALLRLVRRVHRHVRRHPPARSRCARRPSRPTSTPSATPSTRGPGSCCSTARTTRPAQVLTREELAELARLRRRARSAGGQRRGVRAPHVRRRAHPDRFAARDARAHRDHRLGRQVVLDDRLEGRVGSRACPELVTAVRTAKQFLTYVSAGPFQPAIAVGLRLPDSYFLELAADLQVQARPDLRRAGRGRVRRLRAEGHLLRPHRHPAARRDRRAGVLPVAARAVRPRRHPVLGLLRRQGGRPQPGALRVLQAPRGARRRGRQAEGALGPAAPAEVRGAAATRRAPQRGRAPER